MIKYIVLAAIIVAIAFIMGYAIGNRIGFTKGVAYVRDIYLKHMDRLLKILQDGGENIGPFASASEESPPKDA